MFFVYHKKKIEKNYLRAIMNEKDIDFLSDSLLQITMICIVI